MKIDYQDDSVCVCEGGVWFYLYHVAETTGASIEDVKAWVENHSRDISDILSELLVDTAIDKVAQLYKASQGKG